METKTVVIGGAYGMPERTITLYKVAVEVPERTVNTIAGLRIIKARTRESWHTQDCINSEKKYKEDLAAFEAAYPNYCRSCGGTGVVEYTENQSPLGSGYYWPMNMTDMCGDCLELGNCPLCGGEFPEDDYEMEKCPHCEWAWEENNPCAPWPHECHCYRFDLEEGRE